MAFGFTITSGTGSTVTQQSTDTPPGIYLDTFLYTWSTTPVTYSYPTFAGTRILPVMHSRGATSVSIIVDNTAKTITITGVSVLGGTSNAYFIILGV